MAVATIVSLMNKSHVLTIPNAEEGAEWAGPFFMTGFSWMGENMLDGAHLQLTDIDDNVVVDYYATADDTGTDEFFDKPIHMNGLKVAANGAATQSDSLLYIYYK